MNRRQHPLHYFKSFQLMTLVLAISAFTTLSDAAEDKKITEILDRQQVSAQHSWQAATPNVLADTTTQFPNENWWQTFNDTNLNNSIETALNDNPDLKAYAVQIKKAEAASKIARSSLLPSLSFNPQYMWQQYGKNQFLFPLQTRTFQSFQLPLTAQYEVDLFGKNLSSYRSAKKGISIASFQYQAARIQIAGQTATAYFNAAKWRYLEKLSQEELISSDKLLKHQQRLLDLGLATLFDVQDIQQKRDQAQVNVTLFANNRELAENSLLALMGQSPTSHPKPVITDFESLTYPTTLDTGLPSELVTHRPDIAAAEAQLAAAQFDIKAARRAFLPSILLTGSTGFSSVGITHLLNWSSLSTFGMTSIAQAIYSGGRLKAELNLKKADYEQLLNTYESTLIAAFTDAENSLATLHSDQVAFQDVTKQTENARQKAASQQKMFKAGVKSETVWLAEDVQRLQYEKLLAQQKNQVLIDTVGVAKAMGGGF